MTERNDINEPMTASNDINEPTVDDMQLDPNNVPASLQKLYRAVDRKATDAIKWYRNARKWKRRAAGGVRYLAILFYTLAGLVPVLKNAGISFYGDHSGQYGYLFAAIATALLGLDKFTGFSSGWVRYALADLDIDKARAEFQGNWLLANTCLDDEEAKCAKKRLQLLKEFSIKVTDLIDEETRQWATEFQSSLAQLDKAASDARDASKPGMIAVTITRGATLQGNVDLFLDGQRRQSTPNGALVLDGVTPGLHQVSASGTNADGTSIQDAKAVQVPAGGVVSVAVNLG